MQSLRKFGVILIVLGVIWGTGLAVIYALATAFPAP